MAILGPVVQALVRSVAEARRNIALRRGVGAEPVGDDPLWDGSSPFQQGDQKPFRGRLVPSRLENLVEHHAMLIDGAPEPEGFSGGFHRDFVQVPDVPGKTLPTPQVPCDLRPELGGSAPDGLVGYVDAAFQQHLLHLAQAQIEPT